MYEELYSLIKENERSGDFTHPQVNNDMLQEAENQLNLVIPNIFKWFLVNFGQGGIGGIDVLGVGKNGKMVFVNETLKYRSYGLPRNVIVVENCDEWVYCINTTNEKIEMWSPGDIKPKEAYESFETYLLDRINDILENRIL